MLDLTFILTKLRGHPSQTDLAACRAALVRHMRGQSDAVPMGRDLAEAAFLKVATILAAYGASEMDLRDLLDREDACLDRSTSRHSVCGPRTSQTDWQRS